MTELPQANVAYEVHCPHCRRPFTAEVMEGSAARHTGFKCPHCKLFVPYERADERDLLERADERDLLERAD